MVKRDWLRLPKSSKLPFGGFNATLPHSSSENADRLVKIANRMACGQAVDPELALWFFQAVKGGLTPQGKINADRFMRALGLMNGVGNDGKYSSIFKAHWAGRFYEMRNRDFPQVLLDFENQCRAEGKAWPPKRGSKLYATFQTLKSRHNSKAAENQVFDEMKSKGITPLPSRSVFLAWLAEMQSANDTATTAENPAVPSGK